MTLVLVPKHEMGPKTVADCFRLFGSVNVPALNEEQWKEVKELASVDLSRARQASDLS